MFYSGKFLLLVNSNSKYFKLKQNWTKNANINIFISFGELPCESSLLPSELAKIMTKELFTVFEQFKECKVWKKLIIKFN
jgi:hypothetical protein